MRLGSKKIWVILVAAQFSIVAPGAHAYSFNQIVPDVRQPPGISGGSACPVRSHQLSGAGSIAMRWSTALNTNPVTILTQDQTAAGALNEIEQVIVQSLAVWTGVPGTTLAAAAPVRVTRVATASACGSDGVNSICFDQSDMAFSPGVLAFTRVITADRIGVQVDGGAPSTEVGQILDADIYFNPGDARINFATPAALSTAPKAYDLESILAHELGHLFGFSHSAVWSAMMFPFAAAPGTFTGMRPSAQIPDAPLGDDDRAGLRVLYPDPADTVQIGRIAGRILAANPLSLPEAPPGVSGIFGSQVVAVDTATGSIVAAALGGWSCTGAGPTVFDGSYAVERLPVGRSYTVYAEPLNGAVDPAQVSNATASLCRNSSSDAGWPALQGCVVPPVDTTFTARTRFAP